MAGGALRARCRAGLATCISTNDTDFVEQVATRVCFLVDGHPVRNAPLAELLDELGGIGRSSSAIEVRLQPPGWPLLPGWTGRWRPRAGLLILAHQRDGLLSEILATLGDLDTNLVDLKVRDPGLADCFLKADRKTPP